MATKSISQISTLEGDAEANAVSESVAPVVLVNGSEGLSGTKERITIHSSTEDGGTDAVFLSHNGYAYQIPRDQPFLIPTEVAQVLRDAVTTVYKPGAAGAVSERLMPRYAFSSTPA